MSARRTSSAETPLLAWGEALRTAKLHRKKLVRRGWCIAITSAAVLASAAFPPLPRLVWNASDSVPVGLYLVTPGAVPYDGAMVAARMPGIVRPLAAERGYLPKNVPLIKRVAALEGDEVCAFGRRIYVNGTPVAERRIFDRKGRRLPFWLGCTRLRGTQFLLLADHPDSFDGRYFEPSEGRDVIGTARLIWRR